MNWVASPARETEGVPREDLPCRRRLGELREPPEGTDAQHERVAVAMKACVED